MYTVSLDDRLIWKGHVDQIIGCQINIRAKTILGEVLLYAYETHAATLSVRENVITHLWCSPLNSLLMTSR